MLETPFGMVRILADGQPIGYEARPCDFNRPMTQARPLAGCFRIPVRAEGYAEICCVLEHTGVGTEALASSGECYQALEFVNGKRILTIGAEADHPAFCTSATPDWIAISIQEPVAQLVFGIAWSDDYGGAPDVRTWFAADPTYD